MSIELALDMEESGATKTKSQQAAERILTAIISRQLKPGQYISENTLPKHLDTLEGFARSSIREALLVLQSEGIVKQFPRVGTIILEFGETELSSMMTTRWLIETRCACYLASSEGVPLDKLETLVARMSEYAEGPMNEETLYKYFDSDMKFHVAICLMSGNKAAVEIMSLIKTKWMIAAMPQLPYDMKTTVNEHKKILNAIKRHDIVGTFNAVDFHLSSSAKRWNLGLEKQLASFKEFDRDLVTRVATRAS